MLIRGGGGGGGGREGGGGGGGGGVGGGGGGGVSRQRQVHSVSASIRFSRAATILNDIPYVRVAHLGNNRAVAPETWTQGRDLGRANFPTGAVSRRHEFAPTARPSAPHLGRISVVHAVPYARIQLPHASSGASSGVGDPRPVLLIVLKVCIVSSTESMRMMVAIVAAIMMRTRRFRLMGVTIKRNHPGSPRWRRCHHRSPLSDCCDVGGRHKLTELLGLEDRNLGVVQGRRHRRVEPRISRRFGGAEIEQRTTLRYGLRQRGGPKAGRDVCLFRRANRAVGRRPRVFVLVVVARPYRARHERVVVPAGELRRGSSEPGLMLRKCDSEVWRKCRDHVTPGVVTRDSAPISELVGMFPSHLPRAHADIDSAHPPASSRHGLEWPFVCGVGLASSSRALRGGTHRPSCGRDGRVSRCTGRRAEIERSRRNLRSDARSPLHTRHSGGQSISEFLLDRPSLSRWSCPPAIGDSVGPRHNRDQ